MSDPYAYCATLTRDQWAWEFLRRNPAYRTDYQQFITIWQTLEADYGAPPNRDFQRWKRDPRAYGPLPGSLSPNSLPEGERDAGSLREFHVNEDQSDTTTGDLCIGEDERVMLECWMGAKWGFHKFPFDPDHVHPPTPDELSWRALPAQAANDIEAPYRLDIAFDLSLPLPPQLDAARFRLATRISELRRAGHVAPIRVASEREHWTQLLKALDGRIPDAAQQPRLRVEAQTMVETGYQEILRLAE